MQPRLRFLFLYSRFLLLTFIDRKKKLVISSSTQITGTSPVGMAGMAIPVRWALALATALRALQSATDVVGE
jgi:hypothetical protein